MTSRAERRHPELEQRCAWCHAIPGLPCTNGHGDRREKPHPGRKDAWIRAHFCCPDCGAPAEGGLCMTGPQPMTEGVHRARAQAAEAAYEAAVEAGLQ